MQQSLNHIQQSSNIQTVYCWYDGAGGILLVLAVDRPTPNNPQTRQDTAIHKEVGRLLKELGIRAVDATQIRGCYITPSACHDVALLQPGFNEPEDAGQRPDFYWVVNNTLLRLF